MLKFLIWRKLEGDILMGREYFIDVNLGNECNFRCKYCYEETMESRSGTMPDIIISKTIKFIEGLLDSYKNDIFVINFWGGEPLLHVDQMKAFLNHFATHQRIKFMMITNGSMIEHHKELLLTYRNKLMIQVSYDFEPCNSKNRTTKEMSDKIRANMYWLDENKFNWWTKSTMFTHDISSSLYDTYLDFEKFSNSLKNTHLTMNITPDTRVWEHQIFDISSIEEEMKKLLLYFVKNKKKVTNFTWFDRYGKAQCNSPNGGCLVDIDGGVYPCHGCSYMPTDIKSKFLLYSIFDEDCVNSFITQVSTFDIHQSDKCKNCDVWLCYRCNSAIAQADGSIDSWNNPNPDFQCKIYKTISKYIYAYNKLKQNF